MFNILIYSFLLPIIVYLILRKRIQNDKRMLVLVFYSISIFIFLFFEFPIEKGLKNTLYTITEFLFFSTLIYQQLKTQRNKSILIFLAIVCIVIQVIHFLTVKKVRLDSIPIGIETILIFFFTFLYFQEQLKKSDQFFINKNYFTWIAIGILVYLGGCFFIYLLANNLTYHELIQYWKFTYIVELIKNALFIIAMFLFAKEQSKVNGTSKNPLPNLDFTL